MKFKFSLFVNIQILVAYEKVEVPTFNVLTIVFILYN